MRLLFKDHPELKEWYLENWSKSEELFVGLQVSYGKGYWIAAVDEVVTEDMMWTIGRHFPYLKALHSFLKINFPEVFL